MSLARLILIYASIVAALGTAGRYLFAAIRWIYGWVRNIDVMVRFVKHMHNNELPHIHASLQNISTALGIPYDPPVDPLPLNGEKK